MRLIDAYALEAKFSVLQEGANLRDHVYLMGVLSKIDNAPTIDAVQVVHGRWVTDDLGRTFCSECKSRLPFIEEYDTDEEVGGTYEVEISETNYCPNCGAKMDGKEG